MYLDKEELYDYLLNIENKWQDIYDVEISDNKYIRKVSKSLMYFTNGLLYKIGLAKYHEWPETYGLIGLSSIEMNKVEDAKKIYNKLIEMSDFTYGWGLPVNWHSGEYIFPPKTMMSTTTSEIANFLLDLDRKYNIVPQEVFIKISYNLIHKLNHIVDTRNELLLSYSPLDKYVVNNANLLVASALANIGLHINDEYNLEVANKITNTCIRYFDKSGGISYFVGYDIVDAYHQIFCIRALLDLAKINSKASEWYERSLEYLERELMDSKGRVYLKADKKGVDLQSTSEALRLYKIIDNNEKYDKVYENLINDLANKNKLIQRMWIISPKHNIKLMSRNVFIRQGLARLLVALK